MPQVIHTWHLLLPTEARVHGIDHRQIFRALKAALDTAAVERGLHVLHYGPGPRQMSEEGFVDSCQTIGIRGRTQHGAETQGRQLMEAAGKALIRSWNESNTVPGWRLVKHRGNGLEVAPQAEGPKGAATPKLDRGASQRLSDRVHALARQLTR